jgi:tetratricopeptide (TPR) repeat protein
MVDLRETVLANQSFGPQDIDRINRTIIEDPTQFAILRDAVNELQSDENLSPASMTRLGVCQTLIGRFKDAQETLKQADGGALAQYFLGKVHFQLADYEKAVQYYEAAQKSGYTVELCQLAIALNNLLNIFISVVRRLPLLAVISVRPWLSIIVQLPSIRSIKVLCSVSHWKTIDWATTGCRWITISVQRTLFLLTLVL